MEEIDKDFELPYFIFNKIIEYTQSAPEEKLHQRKIIRILLRLQVSTKRLSMKQFEFLMKKYCNDKEQ